MVIYPNNNCCPTLEISKTHKHITIIMRTHHSTPIRIHLLQGIKDMTMSHDTTTWNHTSPLLTLCTGLPHCNQFFPFFLYCPSGVNHLVGKGLEWKGWRGMDKFLMVKGWRRRMEVFFSSFWSFLLGYRYGRRKGEDKGLWRRRERRPASTAFFLFFPFFFWAAMIELFITLGLSPSCWLVEWLARKGYQVHDTKKQSFSLFFCSDLKYFIEAQLSKCTELHPPTCFPSRSPVS